jgi:hypothetical protein
MQRRAKKTNNECKYCGWEHEFIKELCQACRKTCAECKGEKHFYRRCRRKRENYKESGEKNNLGCIISIESELETIGVYIKNEEICGYLKFLLDAGAARHNTSKYCERNRTG